MYSTNICVFVAVRWEYRCCQCPCSIRKPKIERLSTQSTTNEPATEQFESNAWCQHWQRALLDWRRHEHISSLDVAVVEDVSRPLIAAQAVAHSWAGLFQAWRSLYCGRCPSGDFNSHRTTLRSATRTVRNMLVHATEICYRATFIYQTRRRTLCSVIFRICYRAILASTECSDCLFFSMGLGQTASSTTTGEAS